MKVFIKSSRVKKILAKKNMSQNCFAMRLCVSSGYMSQLMAGVRTPSPALRERILVELKMNDNRFDEIFELKG
jgi:transcriptional regulator with XRE-family HTH domain